MTQTRRQFLQGAAALALGAPALLGAACRERPASACVIVGAGLAGLAAAYRLNREGWNVTVLEARDRIGGRVFSYRLPENPSLHCELGGEWIGVSHERMLALCREFGLELQDHTFAASLLRNGVVTRPDQWAFSPSAQEAYERFRDEYERYQLRDRVRLDRYDWWSWLRKIGFSEDDLRLRDLMDSTDFGESIRHVSAYVAASGYFESAPSNEMDYKIVGGNTRLPEALAARLPAGSIRLGAPVTAIRERGGRVTVMTGTNEFHADACICTVPAPALSAIRFDPPLSAPQRSAAEELQYARIVKSSVLFRQRFWDTADFSLVTDRTSHYYFHSTKNQPGTEGILCAYAVGEKADVLAAQDDRRRMEIISEDLRPLSPGAPELSRGIASYAWQRDPYTHGAYAVYRRGQWFSVRPALQRPHGKVLFAGEHLAEWQGYMEGAVVSGEAAAEALLD